MPERFSIMETYHVTLVLLALVLFVKLAGSQPSDRVCMLLPKSTQECFRSFEGKPISDLSSKVYCLQNTFWDILPENSLSEQDQAFLQNLTLRMSEGAESGWTSPPKFLYPRSGHRVRKEYRLLTPDERQRFHSALQSMYKDGYIGTFARLQALGARHYGGASFLPWNRLFLVLFEEALRKYDPKVSIPYWASTIDNEMDNPVNSVLWTAEYFGNGDGPVSSGPGALWVTPLGNLERNFGKESRLFSSRDINRVMSRCFVANISKPTAARQYDLEFYHGGPHMWIGGDMGGRGTAGFDPVFIAHRAYVDFIWDNFRKRQRVVCSVEPSADYPEVQPGSIHHPDAPMSGLIYFKNRDGIKAHWTDSWYAYDQEPSCPFCCPGCQEPAPLYCDTNRNICVSRSKLIDKFGQLIPVVMESIAAIPLPETRVMNPISTVVPRNRGELFDAPPNDGRTYFTAVQDAVDAYVPPFQNGSINLP